MDATNLFSARVMMAGTLGFHIVLAALGVGMPALMLAAEWRCLRTGDALWKTLARRWSKVFAVLFAVGAVSGTVLSFELGLLWPGFMGRFGGAVGLPFTLEGFAFFLEGIFVGVYLYGWERLSPWAHWLAGWPIAISGAVSAFFVVTANAFMNCPRGVILDPSGTVIRVDPLSAMFNPASLPQASHMIVAAYMVSGFLVGGMYAARLLRDPSSVYHRRALTLALSLGAVAALAQMVVGDWAGRTVAATQPAKLAAMEGQFATEKGAPLRIGGWPNVQTRQTRYAILIPGGLSWLAYGDPQAEVRGLDDFPQDQIPPVLVPHVAFQLMVAIGSFLAGVALLAAWPLCRRGEAPQSRLFLLLMTAAGPLAVVALEAGWTVTEVGRQPWIVHGMLRTSEAVTHAPGIAYALAAAIAIYMVLGVGTIVVLRLLARVPLPEPPHAT